MNDSLADRTVKHYVCARCWGHLTRFFEGGENIVRCNNPDCNGAGYVTRYYADRRRQESAGERLEVRPLMEDLGIYQNPNKGKSPDELIKELGF